jgi:hypothetical protein
MRLDRKRPSRVPRPHPASLVCAGLLALGACAASVRAAASILEDAGAFEWTDDNLGRLDALLHNVRAVGALERQTLPRSESSDSVRDIGDFSIVDLNKDGHVELVCTVDPSGHALYTHLVVLSQQNGQIARADLQSDGASITELGSRLVDLGHNGVKEILIPHLLAAYAGSDPVGEIPDIYKFDHGELVNVDRQFSAYYRHELLPQAQAHLAQVLAQPASPEQQKWAQALRREIDAIEQQYGK